MYKYFWIAVAVIALDQASKYLALQFLIHGEMPLLPFFKLSLAFNTGAAFSFLSNAGGWQNLFFAIVAGVVSVGILFFIKRLGPDDTQTAVGLWLIVGGAVGNLIDRLYHGYVVDFLDVYYRSWHWPTFNVADSAITIGAVLLILDSVGVVWRKPRA